MINGIINVRKERGYTSFDVVASLRKILGQKKIGHTGTLDPDAEGVLVVCLGKATKVTDLITDRSKTYRASLLLGTVTDTLDTTGTVLKESGDIPDEAAIRAAISSFKGEIEQLPPMYSAIRINGKHLYELARKGEDIERSPRPVTIYDIEINDIKLPYVDFTVTCSKGTYIRTLCDDIGKVLGCGGCMAKLLRTCVGEFSLEDSLTLSEIKELNDNGSLNGHIIGIDRLFEAFPKVVFKDSARIIADNGNPIASSSVRDLEGRAQVDGQDVRMYDSYGFFYGIYTFDSSRSLYRLKKFFKEA